MRINLWQEASRNRKLNKKGAIKIKLGNFASNWIIIRKYEIDESNYCRFFTVGRLRIDQKKSNKKSFASFGDSINLALDDKSLF